jgi:hypothetical protein
MGVHCVVHKENLTIESLGDYIEAFMINMYSYFNHSLKNTWSFRNWIRPWKWRGIFKKKFKTIIWMLMLEPLKIIMLEYWFFCYNDASWLIQARWQMKLKLCFCFMLFYVWTSHPMCDVSFVCLWFYDKQTWACLCFVVDEEHLILLENCLEEGYLNLWLHSCTFCIWH